MPIFLYEGRDSHKRIKKGKRIVESAEMLGAQLMKEGITPISIKSLDEAKDFWGTLKIKLFKQPIKLDDLSMFARQMYTLCKTGVPISNAIKHLADGTSNKSMADALYGIVEHLEAGEDMATSMEYYPNVFPPLVTSMIKVGQSSGKLAESFLRINQYIEVESSTLKDVKSALRYPLMVVIALVGAIILINIFVIPAFSTMFKSSKLALPLPTQILVATSDVFINHWGKLLLVTFAIIGSIVYYLKTPIGKYKWHSLLLRMPVVGKMIRGTVLLRFSQTFSMTLESGIPLIEGIELVSQSMSNEYAKQKVLSMRDAIEHGNSLTEAATRTGLFNSLEIQMLAVSEETGELSGMLDQIAAHYKNEVDYDLKRLSSIIEPALILVLSGVVLILALAIYLPVWNMAEMAKG
jgi:MSHA biogenesis protein MshG